MSNTCNTCGKTFKDINIQTSCAVMHAPGQCCHYGQELVSEEPKQKDLQTKANSVAKQKACICHCHFAHTFEERSGCKHEILFCNHCCPHPPQEEQPKEGIPDSFLDSALKAPDDFVFEMNTKQLRRLITLAVQKERERITQEVYYMRGFNIGITDNEHGYNQALIDVLSVITNKKEDHE